MTPRVLAAVMLFAATCERQPSPAPQPTPDPTSIVDEVEDAGIPEGPATNCEIAWAHLADLECPPAEGHAAWLSSCPSLPPATLACVLATDTCGVAHDCLE